MQLPKVNYIKFGKSPCFWMLIGSIIGVLFTFIIIEKRSILYFGKEHLLTMNPMSRNEQSSFSSIGCGDRWQQNYIDLHRSILNGSLPGRYLVSVAEEGGFTDRLVGTLTEFFFSLLTNRAFQIITYGTLPRFEAAFLSPHINWSRATDPDNLISNLKYTYRGIRGYIGDRSYPSTINTSLYWPIYLINDEEGNQFFLSSNVSKYPLNHDHVTTLFVASNRGRIVRLFDNPYHRSQLFQMGLRPETAVKCAFHFLFSPTDALRTAMSREFSILESLNILKIAINIRVGDHAFSPENDQKTQLESYEQYFDCALNIESFARLPNQKVIWYLTSDSLRLRQLAKQRYGEKILTEEKLRYVHGDCGDSDAKRYGNCTKSSQDSSIIMAAGQILAMSLCDYHVISVMSGFGHMTVLLANQWHSTYTVHTQKRLCTKDTYTSFEDLYSAGAGI